MYVNEKIFYLKPNLRPMAYVEFLGFVAGFCTTLAFLPQVIRTYRTKSTKDLSSGMFIILTIGLSLWIVYGISISSLPIIIANTATLLLVFIILIFKLKYG